MQIFCGYKPVEGPWGGANNFLRALYRTLKSYYGAEIVFEKPDGTAPDLLFINHVSPGPGREIQTKYSPTDIAAMRASMRNAPLVMRAVNLRQHSHQSPWWKYLWAAKDRRLDRLVIEAMTTADHIVFQSGYQKSFFEKAGFFPTKFSIIHNGATEEFLNLPQQDKLLTPDTPLRLFSACFSSRSTKRLDLVARLSEVKGVEIVHAGRWPEKMSSKNVNLLGILSHEEMLEQMKQAHYFLHPAIKDPCPNSMIEALCAGLPVIYNPDAGSGRELGEKHGVAIIENNLEATVTQARENYAQLVSSLSESREIYSIKRAAAEYKTVFEAVIRWGGRL